MAKAHSRVLLCVVAAAVLCAAAPALRAAAWPMRKDTEFVYVETPHYRIKSDLPPECAQAIGSHQEALFRELCRRMQGTKAAGQIERMDLIAVGSQEKFIKIMGDEAKGCQGLYTGDRLGAFGDPKEMDALLGVLRHEGTHQLVWEFIGPTCPVWLNEGLAEFFQNAEFSRDAMKTGQVPLLNVVILRKAIEDDKTIPLPRLLMMTYEDWSKAVADESPQAHIQYPQAWSVVHFLQEGDNGKYRAPLLQYIYHLSRKRGSMEAWAETFGTNYKAFEDRWKAYVQKLKATDGIDCRLKLELLGRMLIRAMKDPEVVKDMEAFRQAVLAGKMGGWKLTLAGEEVEIADRESLADLFRCPEDRRPSAPTSYELSPGQSGQPPVLRCRNHAGYVLETVYEKGEEAGTFTVKTVTKALGPVPSPRAR